MIEYIFFDLDGTLLDTYRGIRNSIFYTLEYFGKPLHDEVFMRNYIGPPLYTSFMKYDGFTEENIDAAVSKFRERYNTIGVYEYDFFEELTPALEALVNAGYRLAVATSKPEDISRIILADVKVDKYFEYIGGSDYAVGRREKSDIIRYVLGTLGIADSSKVLMLGDRSHDITGGKENGLMTAGLLCGYGGREELESCGADIIIEHIRDLPDALNELRGKTGIY